MKLKNGLLLVILCMLKLSAQAQNVKEATWVASIEQEIRTIHQTQLNIPLVETKLSSLFGVEPSTGEILWKLPLRHPTQHIRPLEGTPISFIDSAVLVNISNGKSLDLTPLVKGKMTKCYLIPESYDLFIHSRSPEFFLVIDLYELQVRWNLPSDLAEKPQAAKSKFAGAFKQLQAESSPNLLVGLECPPVSNKAGGIIFAGKEKLTSVDAQGKVIWSVDQPRKKKGGLIKTVDNKTELLLDESRDHFYILKSKLMTAVKLSDGTAFWPEFFETKGDVILDAGKGLMPMALYQEKNGSGGGGGGMFSKSKLNLVDHTTGKPLWPEELELKGFVDQYRVLPDGNIALVTFNQTNSKFQIVDVAQGKFKYADEIKLKGRVTNFIVGKDKVLFATSKGIDLVDLATGNDLLPRMQKFDSDAEIFTIYKGRFVYNIDAKNRKVYRTDLLSDASAEVIHDYKFQTGEQLVKYDVLENGNLFLASAHHMLLFSPEGKILIDKPFDYKGRGMDRFTKVMDNIDKATNTVFMAASFVESALVLGVGTAIGSGKEALAMANSIMAPELETHRLAKNERAAKYYVGLKKMKKDGDAPGSFFVRRNEEVKADYLSYVSKSTGEVIFDIPLAEDAKDPEFSIDEQFRYLYYSPQFVNKDKADFQAIFNKDKLKQAEASNRLGFVAGYQF